MGRRASLEESTKMVAHFKARKHRSIDTASLYSEGQTEEYLGRMANELWKDGNMTLATKINAYPLGPKENTLTYQGVKDQTAGCLKRLQADSCDILYLHLPDHHVNLEETLRAVNELHEAGKFKEFGLSNYSAW